MDIESDGFQAETNKRLCESMDMDCGRDIMIVVVSAMIWRRQSRIGAPSWSLAIKCTFCSSQSVQIPKLLLQSSNRMGTVSSPRLVEKTSGHLCLQEFFVSQRDPPILHLAHSAASRHMAPGSL